MQREKQLYLAAHNMIPQLPRALDEIENRYEAVLWLLARGGLEPGEQDQLLTRVEVLRFQIQNFPEQEEPKWR